MPRQRSGTKGQGGRTRDPVGRRQNIMEAAAKLFAQKGVTATSIREIVQESGESLSTVYYYFDDKDDLFRTVMMESTIAGIAPVLAEEDNTRGDTIQRLRRLMSAYTCFMTENPQSAMMLIRGLLRILEHENTPFIEVLVERFAAIENIVSEGQKKGEISKIDPGLFAVSFIGQVVVFFFANLAAETTDGWPFDRFTDKQLIAFADRTLFDGIRLQK